MKSELKVAKVHPSKPSHRPRQYDSRRQHKPRDPKAKEQRAKYEGKEVDNMCHYCGSTEAHKPGQNCPAYGKQCLKCGNYNPFAKCCHGEQNTQMN